MTKQNNGHFEGNGQNQYWVPDAAASTQTPEELVAQLYDSGKGKAFDPKALGLIPDYGAIQGQGQDTTASQVQTGWHTPYEDGYKYKTYDMNGNVVAEGQNDPNGMRNFLLTGAAIMATAGVAGAFGAFGAEAGAGAAAGAIPVDAGSLAAAGGATVTTGAAGAAEQSVIQQLASNYAKQFTFDNIGQAALKSAAMQLATTGKVDLAGIAKGIAVMPIGTTVGNTLTSSLHMDPGILTNIVGGGAAGATNAAITGGDIGKSALFGGLGGALSASGAVDDAKKLVGMDSSAPQVYRGTGIGGWTSNAYLPEDPYSPTTDYSSGADYTLDGPRTSASLYGLDSSVSHAGDTPVDYSIGDTTNSDNMKLPTYPDLTSMGNGQGLTVDDLNGGVTGAKGNAPADSSVILGDPNSFINDPTILGNTVIGTDTLLHPGDTVNNSTTTKTKTLSTIPEALQKLQNGEALTPAEVALLKSIGMFEQTYGKDLPGLLKSFYASTNRGRS